MQSWAQRFLRVVKPSTPLRAFDKLWSAAGKDTKKGELIELAFVKLMPTRGSSVRPAKDRAA
jgi:hypothetical protein